MLERALDAQVPVGWVTADEVYGGDARLRAFLEQRGLAYVLAVKATQPLWAHGEQGPAELPARELVAGLPARAWRRRSAGDAPRGPGSMTGPGSRWSDPAGRAVGSGCWCAGGCRMESWPSTPVSARPVPAWPSWSGWRGSAGGRGMLPGRQGPGRPGPLPGSSLGWLVSAHGAPRGAVGSSGGERPSPLPCRSRAVEAGGSLIRETPGRVASSPDNDGAGRHCQTVWARQARRDGVREEPALNASQGCHQLQPGGCGLGRGAHRAARLGVG